MKVTCRCPALRVVQLTVLTPVILKGPPGTTTEAGLTVRVKLVLTERLPGSLATTVRLKGEPTVVEGVPEIVAGAVKLRPAGSPLTDKTSALGVSASVNVLVGIT